MQTEKLNVQDIYSGLLKQGKTNKNADPAAESDFTKMLKFSVSDDNILDAGKVSFTAMKKAAPSLFSAEKGKNEVRSAPKTDTAKKNTVKNAGKTNDDDKISAKSNDVKRDADKKSGNDDGNVPSAKREDNAGDVANVDRKPLKKDKDDKKDDELFVAGDEHIVFSPVLYKQNIETDGAFSAEVVPAAVVADGDDAVSSPFAALSPANDDVSLPSDDGVGMIDAVTGGKTEKTDFTSGLNPVGEIADAAIFSRMAIRTNSKTSDKNVFAAANDNQGPFVDNDADAVLSNIDGMMKSAGKTAESAKKQDVSAIVDMQAKNISAILGTDESVVITVGGQTQNGKKDGAASLTNSIFPVICENVDGNTEIISGGNTLSPVAKLTVPENGFLSMENDVRSDVVVGEQKAFSGDAASVNAGVFTSLLNSESGSGDDGELNVSGLQGIAGYSNNAKISASLKHPKEVSDVKPEINIDDVTDQIKIKVGKLKEGENTVSIKLKPQELGEIQVKLNLGKDGKITAEINSSKEETHVLLQKNVEVLQKMMSDNGYKSDVSGFSFNFRGSQNGNNGNQEQQNQHRLADGDFFSLDGEDVKKDDEIVYSRRGILA